MKTSAYIAILVAATATVLSAHPTTDLDFIKCREYPAELREGVSKTKLVEHDLLSGTWRSERPNGHDTYLFTKEGVAQVIQTDKKGHVSYLSSCWRVAELNCHPILILTGCDRKEKRLRVNQTCEGITLTDLAGMEELTLHYLPLDASAKFNKANSVLVGEWTNVSALENLKAKNKGLGFFFEYQFAADGTYVCKYGNQEGQVTERGSWEISKDNQFLLLQVGKKNDLETERCTQVIRIAQMDDHGLILEQVMKSSEVNEFFGSGNKMFAFIK